MSSTVTVRLSVYQVSPMASSDMRRRKGCVSILCFGAPGTYWPVIAAIMVGEDWIAVREGFPVAAVLSELAAIAGSPPRIVQRINDFHVVAALVAAGHGVALLPRYTALGHPGLRLVPLAGNPAARQVDALVRPDHAQRHVVRRVLDELLVVAGALGA